MNRFMLFMISFLLISMEGYANHSIDLLPVTVDLSDQSSLQRGAKIFMNYCSGCHSLRYLRYNQMATDLGLTTFDGEIDNDLLINNLIFTKAAIHDPIEISLPSADARQWFGVLPPDLSLSARKRGARWLYTYLKSFYVDENRPFGSNNLLIPEVAMPNVFAPLMGKMALIPYPNAQLAPDMGRLIKVEEGEMSEQAFNNTLQDLVTFLVYVGEPAKLTRYHIGYFVILFLCLLLVVVYQLKKTYWRSLSLK